MWVIEQYRFPRSKRRRIRKKWARDSRNWRMPPQVVKTWAAALYAVAYQEVKRG